MKFYELVEQVRALLQREGRVSYRALKREFDLDDDYIKDLKAEIIKAKKLAVDEDGEVLVWLGEGAKAETENRRTGESEKKETKDFGLRTPDSGLTSAERRQLTVEFIDVVDSTALSTQLDPEELRAVIQRYRATCATVIRRFAGYLAKYIGDGLLVYFGYPQAHEDDAQRAVRAGLGIIEALRGQGSGVGGQGNPQTLTVPFSHPLQVRIGIHTGLVVAGEMGVDDQPEPLAIVGETPNLAARLQHEAQPNTVVISAATYHLIQGYFVCADLGERAVKGVPMPVQMYHVLGESGIQSRLEVAASRGLTPFVGREQEVRLLEECWEEVKGGRGQVVWLSGEAGIGKSRLVRVLRERIAGEVQTWLECRCSPYHQNSALYPIIELLQRVLGFTREDSPEEKLQKLESALSQYRLPLAETVPLFAALLSLPASRFPLPVLTPQRQKQKTLEALLTWLLAEAEKQPLPFIVEDPQWADPSTLEFLSLLIEQVPMARLLIILTCRPEFTPSWAPRSHLTHLTLHRLPHKQVEAMVEKLTGDQVLPAAVVQQIVAKTDGVPLFVEELTKMVLELVGAYSCAPLPQIGIPTTLHDALMARLDRLGPTKEVAQLGATLGREFSYDLLHAVSPLDETALQQGLQQLVEAELLYQRGLLPQATYLFKHALIQEAAYQSLLKSTRQQYHQQIAQVLEQRFKETVEIQPELLAHHYTEAGLIAQAILYWQKAGQRAAQRSANMEAISHLTRGLELLKTLPDTPERTQQELALQIPLGSLLMATKGFAAPEAGKVYSRARELCQQIGETPQLFPVLLGLMTFYLVRAEHKTAHELAEQLLRVAQRTQDSTLLLDAHHALGVSLIWLGELTSAQAHLEQGITLYNAQKRRLRAVQDPGVSSLSYGALALWLLGYPVQALQRSQEALALARELSHPFSLAFALNLAGWLHQFRREGQEARERAEEVITLANEQGFSLLSAQGTLVRSWALVEQEQGENGIAQMRQGLAAWQATGAELGRPRWLALLAEAYGKVGQAEGGLNVLAEALAEVEKTGERFYEAELYRLKGQLTLQQFKVQSSRFKVATSQPLTPSTQHLAPYTHAEAEAEACFHKAIEIARKQQAKSLELRATVSLARLWQQQGKHHAARTMLSEIYGWFTEGFDTADLKEAKALLEELAETSKPTFTS
jgi:predicted ATPase/class 3 adenylate cyclase